MTLKWRHVANFSDKPWGNPLMYIGLSAPRGAKGVLRRCAPLQLADG